MPKKLNHEEYIENLKNNRHKIFESIDILSKYESMSNHLLIKDKYGICKIRPQNLLMGDTPTIQSAVNKTEYFLNMVKEFNPNILNDVDYFIEYKSMKQDIEIKSKFGLCKMQPMSILAGSQISIRCAIDKVEYIKNSIKIKYPLLYDKILEYGNYIGYNKYMKIRTRYGWCNIKPADLLNGKCPSIASALDKNLYFKNRAFEIHGDKYDYSKVDYISMDDKITIICKIHGKFKQLPSAHLYGYGCIDCGFENSNGGGTGGYNKTNAERNIDIWKDIKAKVYTVKCSNEDELFYKIGITTKFDTIDRFKCGFPYNIEILYNINTNLYDAVYIESFLHDTFNEMSYKPTIKFGGWTECFSELDLCFIENKYGVKLE